MSEYASPSHPGPFRARPLTVCADCPRGPQEVAYAYAGPLLLLSQGSVEELSGRTQTELTAERFRPNIVISGCSAYDEVRGAGPGTTR